MLLYTQLGIPPEEVQMNDGSFSRFERIGRQMAGERDNDLYGLEDRMTGIGDLESSPDAQAEWNVDARMAEAYGMDDGAEDETIEDEEEEDEDEDEDEDEEDEEELDTDLEEEY